MVTPECLFALYHVDRKKRDESQSFSCPGFVRVVGPDTSELSHSELFLKQSKARLSPGPPIMTALTVSPSPETHIKLWTLHNAHIGYARSEKRHSDGPPTPASTLQVASPGERPEAQSGGVTSIVPRSILGD
ncbi:hypothetical protein BDV10DRAFT_125465 [Aspergillus recurvatus]